MEIPDGSEFLNVRKLKELVNAIPCSRDNEAVAVYELDEGLRFNAVHLDTDCPGVVELNFTASQYKEG